MWWGALSEVGTTYPDGYANSEDKDCDSNKQNRIDRLGHWLAPHCHQ